MALTSLTKPRARWLTFKLKVAQAVSRAIYDRLLDEGVYVEDFGASPSASPSSNSTAYSAAAELCRVQGFTLRSRSGVIHIVDDTVNLRGISSVDLKAEIHGNSDFITVLMGGDSNDTSQYYNQRIFKANRGGPSAAVRIVGSNKNVLHIGEASIVEVWADTHSSLGGSDAYCAYNDIHIQSCTELRIDSNPSTDGSIVQWVNANKFYLQFCLNFSIKDRGYRHNSNKFFGGNFEASNSTINIETGIGNKMYGVRGENALAVTFGANAANNTILTDWVESPNNPVAGASVINLGLNNCVRNEADIETDNELILGFNGSSDLSLKQGVNPSLTLDAGANTVTASSNQLIYTSHLLEISAGNEYFQVIVNDKLSGGIRMSIVGYDSDMNIITSTGDDVHYPGATNEDAGFGETSTTITNSLGTRRIHIKNRDAKWIKLTVNASSSGCSFRSFNFIGVSSSKTGFVTLRT